MNRALHKLRELDSHAVVWLKANVILLIQLSTGIIYLVFGGLKFFPDYSPAQDLGTETVRFLTLNILSLDTSLFLLAILEVVIGLGLVLNIWRKWAVRLALWHLLCTFFPFLILPDYTFSDTPFSLSIVGQYILKNIIIISALLAVYSDLEKK